MHRNCLVKVAEGIFKCIVTGLIVLSLFVSEHQDHLPHQSHETTPVYTTTSTTIGTASTSTTTT